MSCQSLFSLEPIDISCQSLFSGKILGDNLHEMSKPIKYYEIAEKLKSDIKTEKRS